jgi:DNA (cytosine-5)-methyltransferase 1
MPMESILGPRLKVLRTKSQISLKKLAKRLKVDRAHISRIESGKVFPSEQLLRRLCYVVKGDFEELSVLSGRLPSDVREIFMTMPKEACTIVRRAFPPSSSNDSSRAANLPKYRIIDLFSGAGGFTLGFTQTGRFESVFANDFNSWAADTYNSNFGAHCVLGDINELLGDKNFQFPDAEIIIGGPPCQGFSLLNKNREADPRKNLTLAFMEVVRRVKPLAFVMENVPEMLASAEYRGVERDAEKLGYRLTADILNAADYGVAQRRRRAIVVATRVGLPQLPPRTHCNPDKIKPEDRGALLPWVSVGEKIRDLPKPNGSEISLEADPPMDLHFGRNPTKESRTRYRCVPEGGNRFDLQKKRPDLTPACWIRKKSGGTDLFGRLWWDKPAFTIRTEFFKPEKGRYLHPEQHRPITHREAARLQSFPDDFPFKGTKTEIAIQIGNAVAPLLANHIAHALLPVLDAAVAGRTRARR